MLLKADNGSEARGIRKVLKLASQKYQFKPARKLKPVGQITDRQKRRRARAAMPKKELKRCIACGSSRNMRAHHVNGNENDYSQKNLAALCHACNTKIGFVLKKHGIGRRVDLEYKKNPDGQPARSPGAVGHGCKEHPRRIG
jgi:hypothetical protein